MQRINIQNVSETMSSVELRHSRGTRSCVLFVQAQTLPCRTDLRLREPLQNARQLEAFVLLVAASPVVFIGSEQFAPSAINFIFEYIRYLYTHAAAN